jgi:hypothetical protein
LMSPTSMPITLGAMVELLFIVWITALRTCGKFLCTIEVIMGQASSAQTPHYPLSSS